MLMMSKRCQEKVFQRNGPVSPDPEMKRSWKAWGSVRIQDRKPQKQMLEKIRLYPRMAGQDSKMAARKMEKALVMIWPAREMKTEPVQWRRPRSSMKRRWMKLTRLKMLKESMVR